VDFTQSNREREFHRRVREFMDAEIRPCEHSYATELATGDRWAAIETVQRLKAKAKAAGLWNLFLPPAPPGARADGFVFSGERLSNLEYARCAEEMGRISWASEVFNCSPPDTGNMELLHLYGTPAQKERWLTELMEGRIRSAFLMTEPAVASSDASNIQTTIARDDGDYVINGRKWWSSGAADPRCKIAIVMGKSDAAADVHQQHAMILVELNAPGVRVERTLLVYGYDHAPHGHAEVSLTNVRVPAENIILGEGSGFAIAQGRLGPGRIHHCMRAIGVAEEALEAMAKRLLSRKAFGRSIAEHSVWEERIARARIDIDMTRLLCLKAADTIDRAGNKAARGEIAMIKVQAPTMALSIIDDAVQAHGGGGVCEDFGLAASWADMRTLRLVDGPDEVHMRSIARAELAKYRKPDA
jgi:acyl-CoA dehydrogenase